MCKQVVSSAVAGGLRFLANVGGFMGFRGKLLSLKGVYHLKVECINTFKDYESLILIFGKTLHVQGRTVCFSECMTFCCEFCTF